MKVARACSGIEIKAVVTSFIFDWIQFKLGMPYIPAYATISACIHKQATDGSIGANP
jgi:hypothetical protein